MGLDPSALEKQAGVKIYLSFLTRLEGRINKMAEENKADSKKMMATVLKVILGLILIVLGVMMVIGWWEALKIVIQGCLGLFLVLCGLITLAIAKE